MLYSVYRVHVCQAIFFLCVFFFSVIRLFSVISEEDPSFLMSYLNHIMKKKKNPHIIHVKIIKENTCEEWSSLKHLALSFLYPILKTVPDNHFVFEKEWLVRKMLQLRTKSPLAFFTQECIQCNTLSLFVIKLL